LEVDTEDQALQKCAVDTFEKACALDDPWGCTMFGFALAEGHTREKNIEEASAAFTKACALVSTPDSPACVRANELRKLLPAQIEDVKPR
jgi:hypothetical protein